MFAIFHKFTSKKKSRSNKEEQAETPAPVEPTVPAFPGSNADQEAADRPTEVGRPPELDKYADPLPPLQPPQFIAGCGQSVGQQRDQNEDALFMISTVIATDNRQIPFGLYMVADGMGGHQHGEVASSIAVRSMAEHMMKELYIPLLNPSGEPPEKSVLEIMKEGVLQAHKTIVNQVMGGGTTLTAALLLGEQMTIAHVGDSRLYIIYPTGQIEVLTRDHSLVRRLVELGQITEAEASNHPQRNVLYRALGQGEPFEPDLTTLIAPRGGSLLICSDGLWGVVPEEELIRLSLSNQAPYIACQKLVERANEAGGPDNISAVLVRLPQ